jgi:diadenosine tetraphosphate (Ap4A) HIT family hydrolase
MWQDDFARIVLVGDPEHPAFCRVILNAHEREMTDLSAVDCARLMDLVFRAEGALRTLLLPDKMNVASLGNMVAHLHWHVIPRFADDPHFPNSVWSGKLRNSVRPLPDGFNAALRQHLHQRLGQ